MVSPVSASVGKHVMYYVELRRLTNLSGATPDASLASAPPSAAWSLR